MTIAIGMICIFAIATLRDECLARRERRRIRELREHFIPHEEISRLSAPRRR